MTHPLSELVMGRAAVIVTSTCLLPAGIVQLTSGEASGVIQRVGGRPLDITWSACLILGWLLIVTAVIASRRGDEEAATVLERIAALFLSVGVLCYAAVLLATFGPNRTTMILGFCVATVLNLGGRQWFIWRRQRAIMQEARRRVA